MTLTALLELWLDHDPCTEPNRPWLVKDARDEILFAGTTAGASLRFMNARVADTPGARIDYEAVCRSLVRGIDHDRPVPDALLRVVTA